MTLDLAAILIGMAVLMLYVIHRDRKRQQAEDRRRMVEHLRRVAR